MQVVWVAWNRFSLSTNGISESLLETIWLACWFSNLRRLFQFLKATLLYVCQLFSRPPKWAKHDWLNYENDTSQLWILFFWRAWKTFSTVLWSSQNIRAYGGSATRPLFKPIDSLDPSYKKPSSPRILNLKYQRFDFSIANSQRCSLII